MYPWRRTVLLQTLSLLSTTCFVACAFASSRPIHADNIVVAHPHRQRSNGRNHNHHPPIVSMEFTSSYSSIAANQPYNRSFKPSNRLKNWPLAAFHQGNNHHSSNRRNSKPRHSNLQQRQFKNNSNHKNNNSSNSKNSRMCQPPSALSATNNNSDKRRYPPRGGGGGRSTEREALLPNTRSRESSTRTTTTSSSSEFTFSTLAKALTSSKKAKGRAILLLVSFLYGTLNVSLRGIYASDGPPVASVLSLVRQCLSVVTFLPILWSVQNQSNCGGGGSGVDSAVGEKDLEYGTAAGYTTVEKKVEGKGEGEEKKRPMWSAALELAFWNFGAQGLINAGLLFSPAARASFLTQTSVVMTPLISALAGERVKSSVWGGCALALFGLGLISTSHSPATTDAAVDLASAFTDDAIASSSQRALMTASEVATTSSLNQGDFMILAGALSWSTYIFRTSSVAKSYSELDLQFSKNVLLAVMYFGWFLTTAVTSLLAAAASASTSLPSLLASGTWMEALAPLWSGWASLPVWVLLAYSAVGPGAVADLLQQSGQKEVSASESNIILCFESLFAAVCAFVFLGEVSSAKEMTGGLFIVMAAILASK
mmetsp:Transcript_19273/g.37511  ORF Transcript_19273/g.37511 Transcript_19273/m.37511 type:complete len:597 (-) Transcript_19273:201-1991(-)